MLILVLGGRGAGMGAAEEGGGSQGERGWVGGGGGRGLLCGARCGRGGTECGGDWCTPGGRMGVEGVLLAELRVEVGEVV